MTTDHDVQQAFRALRAALRAGTGVMDADGVVLEADDTLCQMLGWTADELRGRSGASVVVTRDREVVNDRSRERRLDQRVQPPIELTVRCADGSTLTVESQTAPLPDGR